MKNANANNNNNNGERKKKTNDPIKNAESSERWRSKNLKWARTTAQKGMAFLRSKDVPEEPEPETEPETVESND